MHVKGAPERATLEGSVAGVPLRFFPYADGQAAMVGIDLETKAGSHPWRIAAIEPGVAPPQTARGTIRILGREFFVQRLTLPQHMVDLDPETERRAVDESARLRTLYRTVTVERLWRGRFTRPVGGQEQGTGFGARRIINGKPRMPHAGIDYAAPRGTPVVASNAGRVALVADYFFPGRLLVLDHGLGLYTLYFHLDTVSVAEGEVVDRGQPIGTVGATGRATGPHLHFGAQLGSARFDPAALLELDLKD
ncbi:MAG: M23 family metallopeptidase [Candidatus Rokubacteria bacterium]|nr:M23 family metallopeptidase [Candidatus Rokubacteria bacterium]